MGAAAQLLGEQLVELVAGALDGLELSRDGLASPRRQRFLRQGLVEHVCRHVENAEVVPGLVSDHGSQTPQGREPLLLGDGADEALDLELPVHEDVCDGEGAKTPEHPRQGPQRLSDVRPFGAHHRHHHRCAGAPNTYPSCGDIPTAWTPLPSGNEATVAGQDPVAEPEWLTLVYNPPVQGANRVDVYETNLGSFVTQVDVWVANGPPIVVFNGPDTTACPGILSIPFSTDLPVVGVTVQTAKVGWEEIDAVAVIN